MIFSSQKTNKQIRLYYFYDTSGRLLFVCFFGGNWRHQKYISGLQLAPAEFLDSNVWHPLILAILLHNVVLHPWILKNLLEIGIRCYKFSTKALYFEIN